MIDKAMSLAAMPGASVPSTVMRIRLRPLLPERLRHQHMGDLGRADAEGERAERAMGGGVAVTADHGQARQGQPLLGPHHMDDALAGIVEAEQPDADGAAHCRAAA